MKFIEFSLTLFWKSFQLPTAGDDAAKVCVVKLENIPWTELAFDHAQVLKDYIEWRNGKESLVMRKP